VLYEISRATIGLVAGGHGLRTAGRPAVFQIHLVLGYVPWLLCFGAYVWPRLKAMDQVEAQRAIATLHSFRFFGLVFIVPGVVGPNLPAGFATFAAYGDFASGVLAIVTLLTVSIRPLFWLFVVALNLVGAADIIVDYCHGNEVGLPALAGELGATYAIPIIYVPVLMITHVAAFYLLARPQAQAARTVGMRPLLTVFPPAEQTMFRRYAYREIDQLTPMVADSGGSRPRIRDDVAHHSDLMSLGVPR
jgi:hypothetical protein